MRKLCASLHSTFKLGIIHRDININNVLIHVHAIEQSEEQLQDADLLDNILTLRENLLKDLTKVDFEVKIADYGLSRVLKEGQLAETACGTPCVLAPEAQGKYFDQRVDVWGVGAICFSLVTLRAMFSDDNEYKAGKWYVAGETSISVECVRFISELVQHDRARRPFPDRLTQHPYLTCNIDEAIVISDKLNEIKDSSLKCLETSIQGSTS